MSDTASFLISEAGEALESLRESFVLKRDRVEVLARLGWTLPPGFDDIGFKVTLVETVVAKWEALLDLLDRENSDKAEIAKRVKELVDAIDAFRVGMRSLMDSLSTSLPLDYLNKTQIHKELLPRLLHL